ncbi:MAG TPA: right-handed parallel beta-helix repeat-containing protein [Candidatus Krumholzibacteria bacterium]|nr:right-handed parallel beta-helix repeat-containing protein [Candidatus Krumholzibacteria bacterium]HPD70278.1 right-handed parallel beta-helix repeat-containing protein [Candidatus Krumholzibacteria bacterium]HRY40022.1 right-handed parallel beta-helix repeat-containing protein [Candidatus Krumholzibacteria bacterium]
MLARCSASAVRRLARRCLGPGVTGLALRIFAACAAAATVLVPAIGLALDHAGTIASDETWFAADNPHVATGTVSVNPGVTLTLEDGVQVVFNGGVRLSVSGVLAAGGTPGAGITFDRATEVAWDGVRFVGAGSGTLAHCTISGGGYGVYTSSSGAVDLVGTTIEDCGYGIYAVAGAVRLTGVTVADCASRGFQGFGVAPTLLDGATVIENSGLGLDVRNVAGLSLTTPLAVRDNAIGGIFLDDCDTPTLDNLTVTGNTGAFGALYLQDVGDFTLGAGNVIGGGGLANSWAVTITAGSYPAAGSVIPAAGNTNDGIRVNGGSSSRSGAWRKFPDVDYVVTNATSVASGGSLTIEDGVDVRFNGQSLGVGGTLTAVGTPGAGITFSRLAGLPWNGLRFTGEGNGTLAHCQISGAVSGIWAGSSGVVDASHTTITDCSNGVQATGPGSASLTQCAISGVNVGVDAQSTGLVALDGTTIEHCGYGVQALDGTLSLINSRIVDNTTYGLYLDGAMPDFGSGLDEWNDIYGNGGGQPGRDLRNGETDIDARYVHWGTMNWFEIEQRIWDLIDDPGLGRVHYVPFANADHDGVVVAVEGPDEGASVPASYGLAQNAPNPFNPRTTIRFDLPQAQAVRLQIYNVAGELVATLLHGFRPAGRHEVDWLGCDARGRPVAAGLYLYRLEAGEFRETRSMMLAR